MFALISYLSSYAANPLGWSLKGCMEINSSKDSRKPFLIEASIACGSFAVGWSLLILGGFGIESNFNCSVLREQKTDIRAWSSWDVEQFHLSYNVSSCTS